MTQVEQLIADFKANGNMLTTGQMVKTQPCEYRKNISLIRKDPRYEIPDPVLDRKHPSNNIYTLIELDRQNAPTQTNNNPTVRVRGAFKGRYKLSSEDKRNLIDECIRIRGAYPETHNQHKKITEQKERLKCSLKK